MVVIWSPNLSVRQILGSEPGTPVRHSVSNDKVILQPKRVSCCVINVTKNQECAEGRAPGLLLQNFINSKDGVFYSGVCSLMNPFFSNTTTRFRPAPFAR